MRRAPQLLFALVALLSGACAKPALEPTLLGEERELDAEVLSLIERKVAAVRASPSEGRAHADLALVYEANGLWDASEQSFQKALQLDDSKPVWRYHRALALREGGQSEAALAELRAAAEELPRDAGVQQRLGQWLLDGGDAEGARTAFLAALAARPDQPEFLTGLAGIEIARGRFQESLALVKRALKLAPAYRPAFYVQGQALAGLGRAEEARPFLAAGMNAKVTWCPDEMTREYLGYRLTTSSLSEEASNAVNEGNFSRAVELFEKLVQRRPDDADMLNNLGANLVELGRFERAAEVLGRSLAIAPESFAVHLNLAELHLRQQKLAEARVEAGRAVELGGTVGRTHFALARVLMLQKDLEGAYRELKAAIALDARDPRMFLALADTCVRMGRADEGRGWVRKALELDGNSIQGRLMQGLLAFSAGDADEARAALAVLEKVAPQDARTSALREQLAQVPR